MATHEELRRRHVEQLLGLLPEALARLERPAADLAGLRASRLRAVLARARRRSPWWARRLRAVPDDCADVALERIEPMTKADLMAHWDEIATDRRLTLAACEGHLAGLSTPSYLFEEFTVVSSSGSSGVRGVFVFDREEFARMHAAYLRWVIRALAGRDAPDGPAVIATIGGNSPVHIGVALAATFSSDAFGTCPFPVTLPLDEIVAGLNRVRPQILFGYATMLRRLAAESEAGRLRIAPRLVTSGVEPLLPEIRDAITAAWGAPVMNAYGTSEFGPMGIGCARGEGIHINEDLVVIEPVDERGRPVPPGTPAPRYYATGLWRDAQALLRYEIADEITVLDEPCACGCPFRRIAAVQGRADELFVYAGDVVVHPHAFREPLGDERGIVEYQVRQTRAGADIDVVVAGDRVDLEGLRRRVAENLRRLGVAVPEVVVLAVDQIRRSGVASKLARFVRDARR